MMGQILTLEGLVDDNNDGQLYLKRVNDGVTTLFPITSTTGGSYGSAHLVCGIRLQWGKFTLTMSAQRINFFEPYATAAYSVTFGFEAAVNVLHSQNIAIVPNSLTINGFNVNSDHVPCVVYFMAIGL